MPKGKYDTPGPFYLEESMTTSGLFFLKCAHGEYSQYMCEIRDAEVADELVGLLNKGNHFDNLYEAVVDGIRTIREFQTSEEEFNRSVKDMRRILAQARVARENKNEE